MHFKGFSCLSFVIRLLMIPLSISDEHREIRTAYAKAEVL